MNHLLFMTTPKYLFLNVKNNQSIYFLLFFCLLFLGILLRTYKLTSIPAGFFADEASIGYNAYTILTNGTDEHGVFLPLFFQAFGEYKSPIQIYTTVPFIYFFGLNESTVRLTSVIYGTLTIISLYLLTKELSKNSTIAFFTAFFLAISPWHIHFSRVAFELMPFVFFTTSGLYFFLKAQEIPKFLFVSTICFIFAIYSYFPARLFIPLYCICIFFLYYKFFFRFKQKTAIAIAITILFLIPFLQHMVSPVGTNRWKQVSIFTNQPKDESILGHIFNNYLSHFSLDFLFLKGDIDMPGQFISRHSIRGIGQLYIFQLPLLLLGIWYCFKTLDRKIFLLLTVWLLLYPLGSMFTLDKNAQATRSIIGVIPFQILSAVGLYYLLKFFGLFKTVKKNYFSFLFAIVVFGIITFSLTRFLNLYFVKYPLYSSDFWGWQYGAKDITAYFLKQQDRYDAYIMSPEFNAPEIFFKFYTRNQCHYCKIGTPDTLYNPTHKQLFAVTPRYLSQNSRFHFITKEVIFYPNNTIAFQIGEIVE